jgi:hypothetical protein
MANGMNESHLDQSALIKPADQRVVYRMMNSRNAARSIEC